MAIEKIRVNGVDYDLGVSGGSEGSGSGMPDLSYNNPELPNLYYGMALTNKTKIKIDFVKMVAWIRKHNFNGWVNNLDNPFKVGGSSGTYLPGIGFLLLTDVHRPTDYPGEYDIALLLRGSGDFKLRSVRISEYGQGDDKYTTYYEITSTNGTTTLAEYMENLGVVEISLDELFANYDNIDKNRTMVTGIFGDGSFMSNFSDLNTYPIDFLTIE